jgi:peptidoglycan/LPS O-acetylase OafA/YrhL
MRNQNLDSLRSMAALWVLLHHLQARVGGDLTPFALVNAVIGQGWLGVDLFVVISGFVISKVIEDGWGRAATPLAFTLRFGFHRLGRIAPLHYLTALIMLILAAPNSISTFVIWANIFFVQNLAQESYEALNGPAWTLGLEMQWYLIAPIIVLSARSRSAVFVLAIALATAFTWYGFVFAATGPFDGNLPAIIQIVHWHTQLPGMIFHFLVGWFVYRRAQAKLLLLSPLMALVLVFGIVAMMHGIELAGAAGRTEFFMPMFSAVLWPR